MKKIIRIASVIALASASLLYVGCTKDFSADIAKTNQDVAALNQKVEALDATVQTINSTVANLQTTKADLSAVNAADQALDGKITALDGKLSTTKDELNAAIKAADQKAADAAKAVEAAAAKAAADLKDAKDSLNGVIKDIDAKIDSLNAISVAKTDSLRKDVDSLYANCKDFEKRIAALEGRVDALAARITSIVAVPSTSPEFSYISISDKDTAFFATTFAVTPKAAVKNIDAKDLKVNFKEGLTRGSVDALDTTCIVSKVVADEAKGEITVFVPFEMPENFPAEYDYYYSNDYYCYGFLFGCFYDGGAGVSKIVNPHPTAVYFSLAFAGKDEAEADYEVNSEYVKAHQDVQVIDESNAVVIVKDGDEVTAADCTLTDTLAFDGSEGKVFASLFDTLDVAFKIGNELISEKVIAELLDTTFKVCADTMFILGAELDGSETTYANDTTLGIYVSPMETQLFADSSKVGNYVKVVANRLKLNDANVYPGQALVETHVVGAKTVAYTLPAVTEEWTYTSYNGVSRTISITNGTAAKKINEVIANYGAPLTSGKFTLNKDNGEGVNIVVADVKFNEEAKDTTYEVKFTTDKEAIVAAGKPEVFTINWNYTLTARPEDAAIALANVDTLANDYTNELKLAIDSKIVDKTFAEFADAYDKAIDTVAVKNAIKDAEVELDSVVFGGKKVENAELSSGKVVLPRHSKAGAYTVILNKVVFGIKYTYTYTINLSWKEVLNIKPTPYVSAGVATVDADTTVSPYTLIDMDLAKYLQVFNLDTLAKGFKNYRIDFKYEVEDSADFVNPYTDSVDINTVAGPESVDVEDGILKTTDDDLVKWNGYKGLKVKVTAFLATGADTVHTYTFTLQYNKPITKFEAGTQTIKRIAGNDKTAVLSKGFVINGYYEKEANLVVDTTGAWVNGENNYGCEFFYELKNAKFYVDGVETIFTKGVDYEVDGFTPVTGEDGVFTCTSIENPTITFKGDNNNKPIEANIPVVLTYKYDYNGAQSYKDNVVIKVVNE